MNAMLPNAIAGVAHTILVGLTPANRRILLELAHRLRTLQELQGLAPAPSPPVDLRPFLDDFRASLTLQGRAPATRRHHTLYATHLLKRYPNPTPGDVEAFLGAKLADRVTASTIRNIIFALRAFFAFLQQKGLIGLDPTGHLSLPPLPHRERIPPPLADVARLFHSPAATARDLAILHLLVDCGLRLGELRMIQLSDIDLATMQVTVVGKGNKQRTVPFSTPTAIAIREHIASLPAGGRWLLPGRPPTNPLWPRPIETRLNTLCDAAGTKRFSPHQLRHLFATQMLNSGANIKVVSQLLGHAHASTTTDIYWHVVDAAQHRQQHQQHNPLAAVLKERP